MFLRLMSANIKWNPFPRIQGTRCYWWLRGHRVFQTETENKLTTWTDMGQSGRTGSLQAASLTYTVLLLNTTQCYFQVTWYRQWRKQTNTLSPPPVCCLLLILLLLPSLALLLLVGSAAVLSKLSTICTVLVFWKVTLGSGQANL